MATFILLRHPITVLVTAFTKNIILSFLFLLSKLSALPKVDAPLVLCLVSIVRLSCYVYLFSIGVNSIRLHVTVLKHLCEIIYKCTLIVFLFIFFRLYWRLNKRIRISSSWREIWPGRSRRGLSRFITKARTSSFTDSTFLDKILCFVLYIP